MEVKKPTLLYAYAPFPHLSESLVRFATEHLPKEHLLQDELVRKDPIERDSHITIAFGLPDREPSQALHEQCHAVGQFTVELGDLRVFEQRDKVFGDVKRSYDVVVIDVIDKRGHLKKLHQLWSEDYGHPKDEYEFHAHFTISYQVAGTGAHTVSTARSLGLFKGQTVVCNEIRVKEFRGKKDAKYVVWMNDDWESSDAVAEIHPPPKS